MEALNDRNIYAGLADTDQGRAIVVFCEATDGKTYRSVTTYPGVASALKAVQTGRNERKWYGKLSGDWVFVEVTK